MKKPLSKITFTVTKRDVELGERMEGNYCPIARSINRTKKKKGIASVSKWKIIVGNKLYVPSNRVQEFIDNFDLGRIETTSFKDKTFTITECRS